MISFQSITDYGYSYVDFCSRFFALQEAFGSSFAYFEKENSRVYFYFCSDSVRDLNTVADTVNIILKGMGMENATFHYELLST